MKIKKQIITKESKSQIEFIDITHDVEEVVDGSGVKNGQVLVFSPHSQRASPSMRTSRCFSRIFRRLLYRLVPIDERYSHDLFELKRTVRSDGRSNGHSHCKNFILGVSETIPIEDGKMLLGDIRIFFWWKWMGRGSET